MPHAGRAAEARAHPTVGSCPSHLQGQTESGMGAELILQPCRGRGKEAVSQQGSLGSGVGHRGINYSTWLSVSLSRADGPAHTLCLSRLDGDRGISPRGMQSRAGSGAVGCAMGSCGEGGAAGPAGFPVIPAVHPAGLSSHHGKILPAKL